MIMQQAMSSVTLSELCEIENLNSEIIIEIVEYGIVKPIKQPNLDDWIFETASVYWIKKAVRLYQDLEIDWLAVALLIDLMQQRESLRQENQVIKRQLKRYIQL